MTKIFDIYDAIVSKVSSELTPYARIPNPYAINENSALLAKKGYGLAIGQGLNTERYVGCLVTWEREFTIVLIQQVVNTENDTTGRASIEKSIIDDHRLLLLAFEADSTLGGTAIQAVIKLDSGPQYLQGVQGAFLAVEILLRVEYQEPTI